MKRYRKKVIVGLLMTGVLLSVGCGREKQVYLETADNKIEEPETQITKEQQDDAPETVFVYVCGEVVRPAVYELSVDARICEAIALAGGFTAEAAREAVNQAEAVADGMMVRIPSVSEETETSKINADGVLDQTQGRLNLNTATIQELMTLSGIGEAKAKSIIAYREENGGFSTVEDIMNVEGIKEGVYNRIKDSVIVR